MYFLLYTAQAENLRYVKLITIHDINGNQFFLIEMQLSPDFPSTLNHNHPSKLRETQAMWAHHPTP